MAETKVTKNEMDYTKTTDAAGYTVYDYGGYKQYRKKGTQVNSLTASQWKFGAALATLPTGMSSFTNHYIEGSVVASDAAVCVFLGCNDSGPYTNMSNQYGGAINNFNVFWSVCITEA